jgi:hypothetical protein
MSEPIDPLWLEAFADRPAVERELGALVYHATNTVAIDALLAESDDDDEAAVAIAALVMGAGGGDGWTAADRTRAHPRRTRGFSVR